jgi:hypothetical protein
LPRISCPDQKVVDTVTVDIPSLGNGETQLIVGCTTFEPEAIYAIEG